MSRIRCAAAFLSCVAWSAVDAGQCGVDEPCTVASGEYRIRLPSPAMAERPVGAVMYFHGYKASAEGVIRNAALTQVAQELGVALLAPHGAGGTWSYPGSPSKRRDEFRFVSEVLRDVAKRFPVDADRIMATGFSMGGSMVWNLACYMGAHFQGFAPVAGSSVFIAAVTAFSPHGYAVRGWRCNRQVD